MALAVSAGEGSHRCSIKDRLNFKFPLVLKIKGVLKGILVIQQNLSNSQECFEAHICGL